MPKADFVNGLKHCNGCDRDKPLTHFYRNSRNRDGLNDRCKDCMANRKRGPKDPEKERQWAENSKQRALQERGRMARQAVQLATKKHQAVHVQDVLENLVHAFGGPAEFAQEYAAQIMEMQDGSVGKVKAMEGIAKMLGTFRESDNAESDDLIPEELLRRRIKEIALAVVRFEDEPELAEEAGYVIDSGELIE